jgi:hypothetical protein
MSTLWIANPAVCEGGAPVLYPVKLSDPVVDTVNTVAPGQGDDLTPPNGTLLSRCNGLVFDYEATCGFSGDSPSIDSGFTCSYMIYDIHLVQDKSDVFNLEAKVGLEFENPRWEVNRESMMVKVKLPKTYLAEGIEFVLVQSELEDYEDGRWSSIDSKIVYTEQAESEFQAVVQSDNSGQVATKTSVTKECIDVSVGPVGERGRIWLKFQAENVYQYGYMRAFPGEAVEAMGSRSLIPFLVFLPWARIDHDAGKCGVELSMTAPNGVSFLSIERYEEAYKNMVDQLKAVGVSTLTLQSFNHQIGNSRSTSTLTWGALPPCPTAVLVWLEVSNPSNPQPWELVEDQSNQLKIYDVTDPHEAEFMLTHLAGRGPATRLVRASLKPVLNRVGEDPSARVIFDITLSDASGSTSSVSNGVTMRTAFNKIIMNRIKNRLRTIPVLVSHHLLAPQDRIMETVFVFDGSVIAEYSMVVKVCDFVDATEVGTFLDAFEKGLRCPVKFSKYSEDLKYIFGRIGQQNPQGSTSFISAARRAAASFQQLFTNVKATMDESKGEVVVTSGFVNLDTDGGNNCGECYSSFRKLVDVVSVTSGCVLGFGNWLDQDCASKVARIINGKALLALQIPVENEMDFVYRQEMSLWIQSIRDVPLQLKLNCPHSTLWSSFSGERRDNMMEVLMAKSKLCKNLKFELPEIKGSTLTTGVILSGVKSGAEIDLYLAVRSEPSFDLFLKDLQIFVNDNLGKVDLVIQPESSFGSMIGHKWIRVLESKTGRNSNLSSHLYNRILEDLSFNWNLPLPSKVTSYFGRSTITEERNPISLLKQPIDPLEIPWSRSISGAIGRLLKQVVVEDELEDDSISTFGSGGRRVSNGSLFGFGVSGSSGSCGSSFGGLSGSSSVNSAGFGGFCGGANGFGSSSLSSSTPSIASNGFGTRNFGSTTGSSFGALSGGFESSSSSAAQPQGFSFGAPSSQPKGNGFGGGFGGFASSQDLGPFVRASKMRHWMEVLGSGEFNVKGDRQIQEKRSTKDCLKSLEVCFNLWQNQHVVNFHCDLCFQPISGNRQHCMDCFDFDMCMNHPSSAHNPKHRIRMLKGNQAFVSADRSIDPLVNDIFGSIQPKAAVDQPHNSEDMTPVIAQRRVQRLWLCLWNWPSLWEHTALPFKNSGIQLHMLQQCSDDVSNLSGLIQYLSSLL